MGEKSPSKAIYPGTFDPITNGHVDLVHRALNIFDQITILVAHSQKKTALLDANDRKELIETCFAKDSRVRVEVYGGLLVDYARKHSITAILRGLRVVSDFEYEFQMATMNRRMYSEIQTVFLMSSEKYFFINSTLVKEVLSHGGDISELVPSHVEKKDKRAPMFKLANRVGNLKTSAVFEISAIAQNLKRQGHDVISLAAGEPDFNTPEPIQRAATEAMAKGITKYTPASGFLVLREAIAEKVSSEDGYSVSPEEVVITCGAKQAIYLALQCLAESGQSVLLPTPAWVSYGPMIELTGAKIFPLPMFEEDGFCPNVDRWKGMSIPKNARGIILNTPNNPTGAVFNKDELLRIVSWAMQRDLWILSDEVYSKILYDEKRHVSIPSLGHEVRDATIVVDSVSKTYAMTGWRLGWAIGNRDLIEKMIALQSQSTSNVTSFVQMATIAALKLSKRDFLDPMVNAFTARRKYCMERLDELAPYFSYTAPAGAFFIFVNVSHYLHEKKMTDIEFSKRLLHESYVGVVPGSAFGNEKYIRLSYATNEENLKKAFDRIAKFVRG